LRGSLVRAGRAFSGGARARYKGGVAHDPTVLPPNLPVPTDDGAALHLLHSAVPEVDLASTAGGTVDLAAAARDRAVFFFYPRTGVPGRPPPRLGDGTEWDLIPGMRGCTPQSCGFRDLHEEFRSLGVSVYAVSTQTTDYQREFVERNHIPFPVLSDAGLALTLGLDLPRIDMPVEAGGPPTLIRRMAWYCERGRIRKVWYPVFPPNENAARVLAWLRERRAIDLRTRGADHDAFVREELTRNWGSTRIWSLGRAFEADQLPGFVAHVDGSPVGLITYQPNHGGHQCEIVTVSSRLESRGVGEHLLEAAADAARDAGCIRAFLTTTNDNLRALGFYQKRGWRIARHYAGMIDQARRHHPVIPRVGLNGIPLRDEIELELWLQAPKDHP
jgi:peroxiredoxin/ribosomal protein S18 acetylase RimI-like enzyme